MKLDEPRMKPIVTFYITRYKIQELYIDCCQIPDGRCYIVCSCQVSGWEELKNKLSTNEQRS